MRIDSEQLAAQLSRGLKSLYTIAGDETLLALEAADRIRRCARAQGFAEREVLTADSGFDWTALEGARNSLSLFSAKKIIELRIPTGKPGVEGAQALQDNCAALPEDLLLLVIIAGKSDWQTQKTAWFKFLEKQGVVVMANPVTRERLPRWIAARLAAQNQNADPETIAFLLDRVEGNLLAAHQEVQKLALLFAPGKLDFDEVKKAVVNVARFDVFQLGEALLEGDVRRYARFLDGLREEGTAPPLVLWALAEEIRTLLKIKSGIDVKLWGAREQLLRKSLKRFTTQQLEDALLECAAIDRVIKGLTKGDPWERMLGLGLKLGQPAAQVQA
jgi:DNA polymerase III subunit delta